MLVSSTEEESLLMMMQEHRLMTLLVMLMVRKLEPDEADPTQGENKDGCKEET